MKQSDLSRESIRRVLEKHGIDVVSMNHKVSGGLLPNDGRLYYYIDIKLASGSFKLYYDTESYGKVIVQILNEWREYRK